MQAFIIDMLIKAAMLIGGAYCLFLFAALCEALSEVKVSWQARAQWYAAFAVACAVCVWLFTMRGAQ